MATITGIDGDITIPSGAGPIVDTNIHVHRWNARIIGELHDVTRFGQTSNFRDVSRGMYHLEGSFEGFAMAAATAAYLGSDSAGGFADTNATPVAGFILQTASGDTYTFAGLMSQLIIRVAKIDLIRVTGTFTSSNTVTVAA